jgi:hypothetical protein
LVGKDDADPTSRLTSSRSTRPTSPPPPRTGPCNRGGKPRFNSRFRRIRSVPVARAVRSKERATEPRPWAPGPPAERADTEFTPGLDQGPALRSRAGTLQPRRKEEPWCSSASPADAPAVAKRHKMTGFWMLPQPIGQSITGIRATKQVVRGEYFPFALVYPVA